MDTTDITVEILRGIRDEIRQTNDRLDRNTASLEGKLDAMSQRMEGKFDAMSQRMTESELRTATALAEVASAVRDVKDLLASRLELRDRVALCEGEIARIKEHVGLGQ